MRMTLPSYMLLHFLAGMLPFMVVSAFEIANLIPDDSNTIVFGDEVERNGRYPYMTVLYDDEGNWRCGGTLVAPTWVLTAAHCADDGKVATVEVGRYHFDRNNGHYEEIAVNTTVIHPRWNAIVPSWDFALLQLVSASTKDVIQLDDGSEELVGLPIFGTKLTVVGFGSTFGYGLLFYPTVLQEGTYTYYENWMCNIMIFPFISTFNDQEICANAFFGGTCAGDSGGPLMVKGKGSSNDVQVGVVSFGFRPCGQATSPDGYGRISSVYDWIQSYIA